MVSATSECVRKEINAGKKQDQAVAICISKQKESLQRYAREAKLSQVKLASYSFRNKLAQKKIRMLTASLDTEFIPPDNLEGQFDSYFLIAGDEINGNEWGVTEESIPKNIESAIEKPFVISSNEFIENSPYGSKYMHPNILHFMKNMPELVQGLDPDVFEDNLTFQEPYTVSIMKSVFFDTEKNSWRTIMKRDEKFANHQMPPFCSISIFQDDMSEPEGQISKWRVTNLTGLKDRPAFGNQATYDGTCNDTLGKCTKSFASEKSLLTTDIKFAQEKIAALLTTDITETQAVPIYGMRRRKKKS